MCKEVLNDVRRIVILLLATNKEQVYKCDKCDKYYSRGENSLVCVDQA